MKKIFIILLSFLLTSCYVTYDQKHDVNQNYYLDWLADNNIINIEEQAVPTSQNLLNAIYIMYELDETSNSKDIRQYTGTDSLTNKNVRVFIPDKVGESNIIVEDIVFNQEEIVQAIDEFNSLPNKETLSSLENVRLTNDIVYDEQRVDQRWIPYLWRGLTVDSTTIEIETEIIQDYIYTNLSSPMIYVIGTYTENNDLFTVYLGLGTNNEYVILLENHEYSYLEIIYRYNVEKIETDDVSLDKCDLIVTSDEDIIGEINGYTIIRNTFEARCDWFLGGIIVDGYSFGGFTSGCEHSLDWIGYSATKNGETFKIQSLVDNGEFTTEEIYNLYICDEGNLGGLTVDTN